jgi:hypothetical protein
VQIDENGLQMHLATYSSLFLSILGEVLGMFQTTQAALQTPTIMEALREEWTRRSMKEQTQDILKQALRSGASLPLLTFQQLNQKQLDPEFLRQALSKREVVALVAGDDQVANALASQLNQRWGMVQPQADMQAERVVQLPQGSTILLEVASSASLGQSCTLYYVQIGPNDPTTAMQIDLMIHIGYHLLRQDSNRFGTLHLAQVEHQGVLGIEMVDEMGPGSTFGRSKQRMDTLLQAIVQMAGDGSLASHVQHVLQQRASKYSSVRGRASVVWDQIHLRKPDWNRHQHEQEALQRIQAAPFIQWMQNTILSSAKQRRALFIVFGSSTIITDQDRAQMQGSFTSLAQFQASQSLWPSFI